MSLRACHLGVLQWQNKFVLYQRQRFPCKYVEELGVPSVAIFYMVMACNVPSVTKLLDMLLILFPLPFCEMELKLILLFMNPFIILFSLQLYARDVYLLNHAILVMMLFTKVLCDTRWTIGFI